MVHSSSHAFSGPPLLEGCSQQLRISGLGDTICIGGVGGVTDYTRASTRINAKLASATQALHLRVAEGAPILRTINLNVDDQGQPLEYGRTWFAGDKVTLTLADT